MRITIILCMIAFIVSGCQKTVKNDKAILLDSYHAHNYDYGLSPTNYDYHSLHGNTDAFNYLISKGYQNNELINQKLDAATLAQNGIFYLNLVSDDLPNFTVNEILSIKTYVKNGGNLFIISDHSNCYNHSHKLEPLLLELGIQVFKETACDVYPNTIGKGNGWVIISDFVPHPVTRGLTEVVFMTGGTVDDKYAVAKLSAKGWGDYYTDNIWGETSNRSFLGDWINNSNERQGALGVVLAKDYGKGKIVVVGDQNVFGNFWIKYADNYKLFINIIHWLSSSKEASLSYESFINEKKPNVLFLENYLDPDFGITNNNGFYNLFFGTSKRYWSFSSNKIEYDYSLIVLSPRSLPLNEPQVDSINKHLGQGKSIVILENGARLSAKSKSLVARLDSTLKRLDSDGTEAILNSNETILYSNQDQGKLVFILKSNTLSNAFLNNPTSSPSSKKTVLLSKFIGLIEEYFNRDEH